MPIKPPNLDDRRYADIVREARALIPQYTPEWTNLGDADPGITLVQLFAWMTEMTIFRLNRVPDKTYVHFLNFIGEERRQARPARVPLTFTLHTTAVDHVEVPAYTRTATRSGQGRDALHYLTNEAITVHDCNIERIVSVRSGPNPMVREIPFTSPGEDDEHKVCVFGGGSGVQAFKMDPVEHGPRAYSPYQYMYLAHDDFRLMNIELDEKNPQPLGRVRIRTASDENLPVTSMFRWEYRTVNGWRPLTIEREEEEVLGLPEYSLKALMPHILTVNEFGNEEDPFPLPAVVEPDQYWIRGVVNYEPWLADRMNSDLEITWRDDRGGEERLISNWDVRATGRNLEFFIQDMPPIRAGWTVRFTMVDRSLPAGRNAYFPRYRWSYRRGDAWEVLPDERVRYQGTAIVLTGPFTEMATDGYNLRAERIETVHMRGLVPNLELELTWLRPVVVHLAAGPETDAANYFYTHQLPQVPWQPATTLPPLLGMKFFVGSDLFENRAQKAVVLELEIGFEMEGKPIPEPKEDYQLQLTYRAADTWRVVHTEEGTFSDFTFADLDPEGAKMPDRRRIRILLDPKTQLKGVFRAIIAAQETCWLRFEVTRATMSYQKDKKTLPLPMSIKVFSVKLGVDGVVGKDVYEQPMPGIRSATVEYRANNRRLSRSVVRSAGRLYEQHPFDPFIDTEDVAAGKDKDLQAAGHHAVYLKLDKPLPVGSRHAFMFRCRGETFLPHGMNVNWEQLVSGQAKQIKWRRLVGDDDEGANVYRMNRTGVLEFAYPDPIPEPEEAGNWIRAVFRPPADTPMPDLPPISHLLLNTVDAINLHQFRMEKFNGEGVPHQSIQLRRFPVFLHPEGEERAVFRHPDQFPDLRVFVTEDDGERREWRRAPGNSLLTASKDDRVFIVDPVDGTLKFGNGIRGKLTPVGNYNIAVETYYTVPGAVGNVGPGAIDRAEGYSDVVKVTNILPATGGRNAESIEEIIRRAPSVLTSRDRAVTRLDFEVIAKEASAEVARAACDGSMSDDGVIEVIVLPQKRPNEIVPDPFLSTGLKEHVQRYLGRRCLVNIQPRVRLATFKTIDVSIVIRLRPNANFLQVRETAQQWIRRFLDPYVGGLDIEGWPFNATLYGQDFGRMVTDIPEVRHVVEVFVYDMSDAQDPAPGWEKSQGATVVPLDKHDLFVVRHVRVVSEDL
ncbi:MAG: baseplate J/gp47 family protein [Alphaproteobacteria bacterium]|nr:baseplate J/gp47 family protein [Alphaproteobacteria bacterium]